MLDSKYNFDPTEHKNNLKGILEEITDVDEVNTKTLRPILRKYPKNGEGFYSKDEIIAGYRLLVEEGEIDQSKQIEDRIRMKPTRTISGVATVTVLTKPFPCPGKCIFCPNDVRMPKSYLADEPGAQRAERNDFDPYLQTYNRLRALKNIGHNTSKVELIVLGGTWSFYPTEYQIWFIQQCFEAMNDFGVKDRRAEIKSKNIFEEADKIPARREDGELRTYNDIISQVEQDNTEDLINESEKSTWEELYEVHKLNESAESRCVGLVIETRPDYVDEHEVIKIRKLGATKVQIGIQSLQDDVMMANMRGHGKADTVEAIKLLRQGGFKIHGHWMPNLYGSTVEKDIEDYNELWKSEVSPDELKIYPTSIIENTQLHEYYKRGKYKPYTYDQLLEVLSTVMPKTPRFCRLTRVIRDIPSTDIVVGNKLTNFRQIAEKEIIESGAELTDIRSREVKSKQVTLEDLEVEVIRYKSSVGDEHFISYRTKTDDKICGFLRLLLPSEKYRESNFFEELQESALIREVHVYGQVVGIGNQRDGKSQHLGLGTKMLEIAEKLAKQEDFEKISVISAVGTRKYYAKKGFSRGELYMHKSLENLNS